MKYIKLYENHIHYYMNISYSEWSDGLENQVDTNIVSLEMDIKDEFDPYDMIRYTSRDKNRSEYLILRVGKDSSESNIRISIFESGDEWYYVDCQYSCGTREKWFKCDQREGVLVFLKSEIFNDI